MHTATASHATGIYKYTVYDVLMAISLDSTTPFEGRTHSDYRVIL